MKISIIMPICSYPDPGNPTQGPHPFLTKALDSILKARYPEGGEIQPDSPNIELLIGVDGQRKLVWDTVVEWAQKSSIPLVCHVIGDKLEKSTPSIDIHGVVAHMYEFPYKGDWGNPQRDALLPLITGEFLHLNDHDDAYFPDALRQLSLLALANPGRPIVTKMRVWSHGAMHEAYADADILWKTKGRVEEGHFGGHMLAVPNRQDLLGRFMPQELYSADYQYIKSTIGKFTAQGLEPVWTDLFLCSVRPWTAGREY